MPRLVSMDDSTYLITSLQISGYNQIIRLSRNEILSEIFSVTFSYQFQKWLENVLNSIRVSTSESGPTLLNVQVNCYLFAYFFSIQ